MADGRFAEPGQRARMILSEALRAFYRATLAIALVSAVINLLALTAPIYMIQVSDRVLSSQSVPTLFAISMIALGLYVFLGAIDYLRVRLFGRIAMAFDADLSGRIFEIGALMPVRLGEKAAQKNPMRDLETVRQFVSGQGVTAIFDVPWMPFYMTIVFLMHPVLGWFCLGGSVLIVAVVALNEVTARGPMARLATASNLRARFLEECRQSAESLHAMGMTHALRDRWNGENEAFLAEQCRSFDTANLFGSLIKILRFLLQSGILGCGAWLAIQGQITPGVMFAASIIASRALAPVEQAVASWRGFVGARQSLAKLKADITQWESTEPETRLPPPTRLLSIETLSAAPIEQKVPYVRNISFQLSAGEALGILGPSGSGKTTLVRAILGSARIHAGAVRLDGAELNQWPQEEVGRFVGYLPQDVQLMNGTIADNISRFARDPNPDDIIEAARRVDIHDMVVRLEKGYDTLIGERGHLLSGGQRQRLGIARAIYGNPFLVILDEPNSNLDSEGESALTVTIQQLKERGSAVIVIAHRVAALSAVDRVLVMEKGQAKLLGPKAAVMSKLMAAVTAKAG